MIKYAVDDYMIMYSKCFQSAVTFKSSAWIDKYYFVLSVTSLSYRSLSAAASFSYGRFSSSENSFQITATSFVH